MVPLTAATSEAEDDEGKCGEQQRKKGEKKQKQQQEKKRMNPLSLAPLWERKKTEMV